MFLYKVQGPKNRTNILTIYFSSGFVAIYTQISRRKQENAGQMGMAYSLKGYESLLLKRIISSLKLKL